MAIDAPIHTNQSNLPRVLGAGVPVVLVFWRRNCPPCDQLSPALGRLAKDYAGRALVVKVDADEEPGLVAHYHVDRLPAIVFVKGGREEATAYGAAGERELTAWLQYLTGGGARPAVPEGPTMPWRPGGSGPATSPPAPDGSQPAGQPRTTTSEDAGAAPVVVDDSSFERVVRGSRVPVLVDCWAPWCGPCKTIAPTVEALAREFAGRALVAKLNVDDNPGVAGRYGIMSIPTLLILKNGQVVDRVVGAVPAHVLRERLVRQL